MPQYDFKSLSPIDFEELTRDLLQAEHSLPLESFAAGPDGGIDLRHSFSTTESLIVQCKHYANSGFAALKRDLEQKELAKVKALAPQRYILATSVGLTPKRKDTLCALLSPYCQSPADIIGKEDLNNLLGKHQDVEERHHKLWLTSTQVLRRLLKNASYVRGWLEEGQIRRELQLYVQSKAYDEATKILGHHHACIISGIPGIGKTTLARILLVSYLDEGYELLVARDHLEEILDRIDPSRKQVIYYDDFLGRTRLGDKLGKNEDTDILQLIRAAGDSDNKVIIFTTREYILAQAKREYERLQDAELDVTKCTLELASYDALDRARILYNHLYWSDLAEPFIEDLLSDSRYLQIIDHPNYSPRVIEWMTSRLGSSAVEPGEYTKRFIESLDNPEKIWEFAFDNHLSEEARQLLLVLYSLQGTAELLDLQEAWTRAARKGHISLSEQTREYQSLLRELDDSFLSSETREDMTLIGFHNPSVYSFIFSRFKTDVCNNPEMYFTNAISILQIFRVVLTVWTEDADSDANNTIARLPNCIDSLQEALTRVEGRPMTIFQSVENRFERVENQQAWYTLTVISLSNQTEHGVIDQVALSKTIDFLQSDDLTKLSARGLVNIFKNFSVLAFRQSERAYERAMDLRRQLAKSIAGRILEEEIDRTYAGWAGAGIIMASEDDLISAGQRKLIREHIKEKCIDYIKTMQDKIVPANRRMRARSASSKTAIASSDSQRIFGQFRRRRRESPHRRKRSGFTSTEAQQMLYIKRLAHVWELGELEDLDDTIKQIEFENGPTPVRTGRASPVFFLSHQRRQTTAAESSSSAEKIDRMFSSLRGRH